MDENNKRNYTKSEKVIQAHENNIKYIKGCNEKYWNDFEQNGGKSKSSMPQYKSAIKRYTDFINKDVLESKIEDMKKYLEQFKEGKTRENQKRYISSFLTFTISDNIELAAKITSSDLIIHLIPREYRTLLKALMSK